MSQPHCLAGLKAARTAANISVEDAAASIGVTVSSYYRFEKGARRIYFDRVCALADLFNCSTEALRRDPELREAPPSVMIADTAVMIASDSDAELAGWTV